ncbi:MAG TPA: hypothetical protein PLE81_12375 [Brevundimonas sp.]|jgi:hypothetical protein|uniref:hypothetical protein n=1 Tax=Brevundimonas sp. TaxID=1871086 RepID=UPI002C0F867F|nr:hypothetical protein [Brevundimonas sp.]HRH21417.1 hypothetical protein [Brevundimonas sp.]
MARPAKRRAHIQIRDDSDGDRIVINFGRVEVEAIRADGRVFEANVISGQQVMERAVRKLAEPGVRFQKKRGVASYRADPKNPGLVIRELLGRTESGTFVDGEFRAVP